MEPLVCMAIRDRLVLRVRQEQKDVKVILDLQVTQAPKDQEHISILASCW